MEKILIGAVVGVAVGAAIVVGYNYMTAEPPLTKKERKAVKGALKAVREAEKIEKKAKHVKKKAAEKAAVQALLESAA